MGGGGMHLVEQQAVLIGQFADGSRAVGIARTDVKAHLRRSFIVGASVENHVDGFGKVGNRDACISPTQAAVFDPGSMEYFVPFASVHHIVANHQNVVGRNLLHTESTDTHAKRARQPTILQGRVGGIGAGGTLPIDVGCNGVAPGAVSSSIGVKSVERKGLSHGNGHHQLPKVNIHRLVS